MASAALAWDKDGLPNKLDKSRYAEIASKNPFGPLFVEEVRAEEGPRIDVFKDVSLAGISKQGDKTTVKIFDLKKGKSIHHEIGVKNEETGITVVSVSKSDVWTESEIKASDGRVTEDLGYKKEFLKLRKPANVQKQPAAKGVTGPGRTTTPTTSGRGSTNRFDPRSQQRPSSNGYSRATSSTSSRPRVMLPSRSRPAPAATNTQQDAANTPQVREDPNVSELIEQAKQK
jgi:hypothetical protein